MSTGEGKNQRKYDSWESSWVASLDFAVEVHHGEGKDAVLHHVYFIQSQERQFYEMFDAHVNYHYQVSTFHGEKEKIIDDLNLRPWDGLSEPPYYLDLCRNQNHYRDDIIVVNQFDDSLAAAHNKVPWEWLAAELAGGAVQGGRGNALFCAGYTGQNSRDGTVLPGMNFAGLNITTKRRAGCGTDKNCEVTMLRAGASVVEAARSARKDMRKSNCEGEGWRISADIFSDASRNEKWGGRWARNALGEQAFADLHEFTGFEGCAAFVTGGLLPGSCVNYLITKRHIDKHNARVPGYDSSPTLVRILRVKIPGTDVLVWLRIGVNVYGKNVCTTGAIKMTKLDKLMSVIEEAERERRADEGYIKRWEKFDRGKAFMIGDAGQVKDHPDLYFMRADSDKDVYLTLYAQQIRRMAERFRWHPGVVIEALLTISLSPSQVTWIRTMLAVEETMSIARERNYKPHNLVALYAHHACALFGGVRRGVMPRVVSSFNHELTSYVAYESCRNLCRCFTDMNGCDSGERFNYTERLKKCVRNGGVVAVSHYWSNVVIGVATMLGVVKDTRHFMEGVTLAPTTKTATKLKKEYGVGREQKHLDGVVTMVSAKMKVKRPEGENLTCEGVRESKGKDIFRDGDLLLQLNDTGVSEWSTDGERRDFTLRIKSFDEIEGEDEMGYRARVRWWAPHNEFGEFEYFRLGGGGNKSAREEVSSRKRKGKR